MAGFTWVGSIDGSEPIIVKYPVLDTSIISEGELCNLETGEADGGATADTGFIGAAVEAVDNTDDGEYVHVIANPGAIYSVADANARYAGELLDIATGAMGVTTDSNHDLMVWRASTATQPTEVIFNGNHYTPGP